MVGLSTSGFVPPEVPYLRHVASIDLHSRPFGLYIHVPFCRSRCGYCDFNTYTPSELGDRLDPARYLLAVREEIQLAKHTLAQIGGGQLPQISTLFFGGGTPTMLQPTEITGLIDYLKQELPLAATAEITIEANPETVDLRYVTQLRDSGVTRLSLGMQSTHASVLSTLERVHQPDRPAAVVGWARTAGFDNVSVDLIYGTPGETTIQWEQCVREVTALPVNHVSAYGLIVESGTPLSRSIASGQLSPTDDDSMAEKYELAERILTESGFSWYEISNWAKNSSARSQHNLLYWNNDNWWGIGPGAHSHLADVRWWNVRHPGTYADRLLDNQLPIDDHEVLSPSQQHLEAVMLGLRISDGFALEQLTLAGKQAAQMARKADLLDEDSYHNGYAVLNLEGRLVANRVVADLAV